MRVSTQKVVHLAFLFFLCSSLASALEFSLRVTPALTIPVGDSSSLFSIGGGGFFNADIDIHNHFSIGPEFGYYMNPLQSGTAVTFVNGGLSAGVWFYPASRLSVRLDGAFGPYELMYSSYTYSGLWWKLYSEAAFRFSPTFTIGAGLGYISFNQTSSGSMYSGVLAGISAQLAIDTSLSSGNIAVKLDQTEPVFPVFAGIYKQNSIGTLKIVNNETAEIRDVTVSFRAGNYTGSLLLCGQTDLLAKHKSLEVPLYADFSQTILNFTENGKIPGEVVVTYSLLGSKQTSSKTIIVDVYNRNTVRWTDTSVLSSFISPNAPEVLDISKYLVGVARNGLRTGLNRNMQFAMYMYEGLKVGGLTYSRDDTTPYKTYHLDPAKLDYVQYPFQTLAYHSGDYDDLGILYAAALESVGVRTAMIPLKNDFLVAISLGITAQEAGNLFNGTDNLLTIADEIWIPVSMAVFREGFVNSWYNAMNEMNEAMKGDKNIDFIVTSEGWKTYPPAAFKSNEAQFSKPAEESVRQAVETDMQRYIAAEFGPKIKSAQDEIRATGGSARLYNELGMLFIRAGMYPEAKTEYKKAAALDSAPAMVNLGNIAILEKDFKTAIKWFEQSIALQPDNRSAHTGLERAKTELELER